MEYGKGINLVGYSRAELGLGESCRSAANVLTRSNIPFGIINFPLCVQRQEDTTWIHKEIENPLYSTNIFHVNADSIQNAYLYFFGKKLFENRINIGYWHWELPVFPDEWNYTFQFVDEIWVPSEFVKQSIEKKSPVPVIKIPHAVEIDIEPAPDRSQFLLPPEKFLFLTMFDIQSTKERKNPMAAINAYLKAFGNKDNKAGLVIKVNATTPWKKELNDLKDMIKHIPNVYLVDQILSRKETLSLIASVDCLVSLHRSEGFGLPLAEAMYLGTPVMGTNWSGNIEFMTKDNSMLVDYTLVELKKQFGPYQKGQVWAEPDIIHAAEIMLKIVENRDFAVKLAKQGKKDIREKLSCERIGTLTKERLEQLKLL
ncbi:glycosyltransferase family 4 protein [Fictibacillus fluitans]|uniref:Glycosyltransferase family 4 protein n=1 Tax=Fictibacillus fluitans TaxID=3058422 RepID=A0ABT8HT24_9BACL|nr:glycosyltransferase family 4 protein [Fictibacillus sp. NE201]MDN4523625.1 glycosyltransferase family 4 protein [Fictibacillus sp. NE201]